MGSSVTHSGSQARQRIARAAPFREQRQPRRPRPAMAAPVEELEPSGPERLAELLRERWDKLLVAAVAACAGSALVAVALPHPTAPPVSIAGRTVAAAVASPRASPLAAPALRIPPPSSIVPPSSQPSARTVPAAVPERPTLAKVAPKPVRAAVPERPTLAQVAPKPVRAAAKPSHPTRRSKPARRRAHRYQTTRAAWPAPAPRHAAAREIDPGVLASARSDYVAGNLADAEQRLERAGLPGASLAQRIAAVSRDLSQAKLDLRSHDEEAAIREFEATLQADRAVGLGRGAVSREAGRQLGLLHFAAALRDERSGQASEARRQLESALRADPTSGRARMEKAKLDLAADVEATGP